MSAVPQERDMEDIIGDVFVMFNEYLDLFDKHPAAFGPADVLSLMEIANKFANLASAAMAELNKEYD
jgi:hypothetical protein